MTTLFDAAGKGPQAPPQIFAVSVGCVLQTEKSGQVLVRTSGSRGLPKG
jgi:hypothetical protein